MVTFLRVVVVDPIGEWELYWARHVRAGEMHEVIVPKCSAGRRR